MQWLTVLAIAAACLQLSAERSHSVAKRCIRKNGRPCGMLGNYQRFQLHLRKARSLKTDCVLSNGKRLNFGETHKSTHFVSRCERLNSTHNFMRPVKCIAAGQELNGGESIKTDSFILTCRQKGNHILGLQTDACVGEFGYAVSVGKTFKKNGLLFRCVKKDDLIGSIAIGCVIQGIAVGLSGTVNIGGFWYKCARYGSDGIQWKVMGCVDNDGERFHPGEKYREGNYVWLCKETKVAIRNALIGCVGKEFDREKEYAFGESWYEKSANQFSFRMMCVGNETSAQIIVTQCTADFELGRKVAHVGQCIRYDDERVLTCIQDEDGRVHIMLGKIDQPNLNNRYALTVEGVECPRIDN